MKIKALKNTSASGQSLEVGSVYDVSDKDAEILIRMGKAEESVEAPACPPTPPKTKKTKAVVSNVDS